MALTGGQKTFALFASVTGVLQGAAWLIMSLICVILFLNGATFNLPSNYSEYYNILLYSTFLNRNGISSHSDNIVTSATFTVFMWLYIVFDIVWIISSILLASVTHDDKKIQKVPFTSKLWANITVLISLLDLVFCFLIGLDFNNCIQPSFIPDQQILNEMLCYDVYLPVMTYAAKGYVLWIVNVVFAYFVYKNRKLGLQHVNPSGIQIAPIPRPVIQPNFQSPINPFYYNVYPNYWNGQNESLVLPQTSRSVNQFNQNQNDGRTPLQSPVNSGQQDQNQTKYLY